MTLPSTMFALAFLHPAYGIPAAHSIYQTYDEAFEKGIALGLGQYQEPEVIAKGSPKEPWFTVLTV
jgi:hypothetical protein